MTDDPRARLREAWEAVKRDVACCPAPTRTHTTIPIANLQVLDDAIEAVLAAGRRARNAASR